MTASTPSSTFWFWDFLKLLLGPKMLVMLLTGFSSGLPLLLTGSTIKWWMREEGLDLTTIGFFGLVGLPYTLKFVWAPVMDWFVPPHLGRRRGWMLGTQISLFVAISLIGFTNPISNLLSVVVLCALITFLSASQDIVLDAYRREFLKDEELGIGSSIFIGGYRLGLLVAGAFALFLVDQEWLSWQTVYLIMGGFMLVGLLTTLYAPEPKIDVPTPKSLREAVVGPFTEFFGRPGSLLILGFILLYKIGDSMGAEMLSPFIFDLGISKTEYAVIGKTFGLFSLIAGGLLGGLIIYRIGILKSLLIFGILQMLSTAGFAILASIGNNIPVFTAVIAFETITSGLGTTAYVAFMATVTNKRFTATQYALLTSIMGIPRVVFGSFTGLLAETLGWEGFYILCTLLAIPGLLLISKISKLSSPSSSS